MLVDQLRLSFFPFTSAVFMPVRLLGGAVPAWQVGLSAGLTLATIPLCLWLAVRLFRFRQRQWGLV